MRRLALLALLLGIAFAPSAAATSVDPSRLALRQADLPSSYVLDAHLSGRRTTSQDATDYPELKTKYRTWGRLGGYQARFDKGEDSIVSRADVFRGASGTHQMFLWFVATVRRQGTNGLAPKALDLGDEAVEYSYAGGGIRFAVAVWRYRRVFSVVGGGGLQRARVLALARTQQRRVVAALG